MKDVNKLISTLRYNLTKGSLDESSVKKDPLDQFAKWMEEAVKAKIHEPNAMVVSTSALGGKPSARVVLLRGFGDNGFVFYTNYNSRKGKELKRNPFGCFTFYWPELQRQVRVEGIIKKVATTVSDKYFRSRPRPSQIGAWASEQSDTLVSRETLERRVKELEEKFKGKNIPRPPHWGGYQLKPVRIEFWQGRPSRLHDRILYTQVGYRLWKTERLAP